MKTELKEYEIQYWILTKDGYDNRYIKIISVDENNALEKAKKLTSTRAKDFSIYKIRSIEPKLF